MSTVSELQHGILIITGYANYHLTPTPERQG